MYTILKQALITLSLLFIPTFANANCGLGLSAGNVNLVWNISLPTQQIGFTVTKSKNIACNYFVTFSKGGANTYTRRMTSGGNILNYQLYKEASLINILEELPDVSSVNQIVSGSFGNAANQSQQQTYYLQIPLNLATTPTFKPSGVYVDTYLLKIYEGALGSQDSDDSIQSTSVTITTTVNKFVDISLVSSGGTFNLNQTTQLLDFGTLTQGANLGFDLKVRSNAGYSTTFSSQNNQVLKHSSPNIATTVPYTLSVNAVPKNLSSSKTNPVVVATGTGQTSTEGIPNPVSVTIGSVANTMAGSYSDNITVTAITTE